MIPRIIGWIFGVLLFNAAALLTLLQLPPVAGILFVIGVGLVVAWWHLRPQPGRMRLLALVRWRRPRAPWPWLVRVTVCTLLATGGVVGLLDSAIDIDQLDPGFWAEVAKYQENAAGALAVLLLAGLVIPAMEELVFRGRVMTTIERRTGAADAVFASSLLFMLAHVGGPHPGLLLIPFVLGMGAGIAVYLSQSIWPGIAVHALWNTLTSLSGVASELGALHPLAAPVASGAALLAGGAGLVHVARSGAPPFSRGAPS